MAAKTGWPMPQARFWIAIASENSIRGQPNSSAIGIWNTPNEALTAKPSIRMIEPPISTGVIRFDGARAVAVMLAPFARRWRTTGPASKQDL